MMQFYKLIIAGLIIDMLLCDVSDNESFAM